MLACYRGLLYDSFMTYHNAPVPTDPAQWPEARGFARLYGANPEFQARLAMALFGLRQDLLERHHDAAAAQVVEATIRVFAEHYPELTQDGYVPNRDFDQGTYRLDERLVWLLENIGALPQPPEEA